MVNTTQTVSAPAPTPPTKPGHRRSRNADPQRGSGALNVASHVLLVCWALMVAIPLLWAMIQSFKSDSEILRDPLGLPSDWQIGAFARAWTKGNIGDYFLNTLIVLVPSVTGTMLLGSMAAYVLARYPFRGNRFIYYLFVAGLTFPIFMGLVPLYGIVQNGLGLNQFHSLILVYIAYSLPFTVFFMHAFFRTLPTAIAEAALVDGASHTKLFFKVMLPMAKPGVISIGIFNVIGQWNQFILPSILMNKQSSFDPDRSVLTQGLLALTLNRTYESDWSALFAGMTMATLPILAVYLVFHRQVQAGLTGATMK